MPSQVDSMPGAESRSERWVLALGRRARGRAALVSIVILGVLAALVLVLAFVQRDTHALLAAVVVMAGGLLTFERRVFDRIVQRQAAEITRLRGGGGD